MLAIDVHCYLGTSLFGVSSTLSQIIREMDRLGIERSVLAPVKPRRYELGPENRRVARAVAKYPSRFAGWCRVDPWQGSRALEQLRIGFDDLGLSGLFLHPWEEQFQISSHIVDPLVVEAGNRGRPVMIVGGHVRVSLALQIAELARRHPSVTFLATSCGQINISGAALYEAELLLREHSNVLMETSGIYREDFIEDCAKKFGAERVVWGSGSPVYDTDFELKRGCWAHVEEGARHMLLYENALRLFWPTVAETLALHRRRDASPPPSQRR